MNNQEAIETLMANYPDPYYSMLREAVDKAVEALKKADEWIPCSKEMPKEEKWIGTKKFGTTISDKVFVTFESQGKRFVKPVHFQNGELGGLDKQTMDAFYGDWKAVAWMPLPKPWEGVDDE